MFKKLTSYLTILLAALILVACGNSTSTASKSSTSNQWETIKEKGTLTVSTPGTLFPTSYHDDNKKLTGYEIDMMNEIAKRLGVKVEYKEIDVGEALTAVDSGQVDISMNNFDTTKERQDKYNLSEPYKYSVGGAIVRADGSSGIEAKDLSDWKGKKAGGGAGTNYMKIAKKMGAEPVIYDNTTNDVYLRDVSTGRTDFIPNDYYTQLIAIKAVTKEYPDIKVKEADVKFNPTAQVLIMSKKDNSLKEQIDKVIKEMKKDGTLKKISEKYYEGRDLSVPEKNVKDIPVINVDDVES